MNKLAAYGVGLLALAAVAALLLDSGSVQHVASDSLPAGRPAAIPLQQPLTASLASRLALGERFASLDELVGDQQAAGFVKIGTFGNLWPATVAEIATDRDEIKFVRQNGTQHHYAKFDGYQMKMVRLKAGNQETIVVFRSQSKK